MTDQAQPQISIDPNKVIDYYSNELARVQRQCAELSTAFNALVEENEKLKAELGKALSASDGSENATDSNSAAVQPRDAHQEELPLKTVTNAARKR